MRLVITICALANIAHATPRKQPFIEAPGVALGGVALGAAFCETSKRAVFRLPTGDVVAVDAAGTVTKLGNVGTSHGKMMCDRTDRIVLAGGRKLHVLTAGNLSTVDVPGDIKHARLLADETVGIVDSAGAVYRWDGSAVTKLWKTTIPAIGGNVIELDATATRFMNITSVATTIHDAKNTITGPKCSGAAWLADGNIVFGDRIGAISVWSVSAPISKVESIGMMPTTGPTVFPRINIHGGGSRFVLERNDGPMLVLELDALGTVKSRAVFSRVPAGSRVLGIGSAPFAVIATSDRAFVVDLTKSAIVVGHDRPIAIVHSMAFSPDGRSLAILGGDRDVLVATLDRKHVTRLVSTPRGIRGPLRWVPDGTLIGFSFGTSIVRWSLDGQRETNNVRAIGFAPNGDPVTINVRDRRLVIERRTPQTFAMAQRALSVSSVDVTDRFIAARGSQRVEVFSLDAPTDAGAVLTTRDYPFIRHAVLVGDEPSVMYVDDRDNLRLATTKTDRVLENLEGFALIGVTADRKRIAVCTDTIVIWDHQGNRVAELPTERRATAIAWSPDLRTLAVASPAGIELWTIPR